VSFDGFTALAIGLSSLSRGSADVYSQCVLDIVILPAEADRPSLDGELRFVARAGGADQASGELLASSDLGDETGRVITVRWADDQVAAARAIINAAVGAAEPGTKLHLTANAEVDDRIGERLALFESCGFALWQEKEGFWWADAGQDLQAPADVTARTLAEVGRERYAAIVASCTAGTLDRIDADAIASMGSAEWAAALIADAARPEEEDSWFVIENDRGEAVGYVAVGSFGEDATGTIFHVGVAVGHRGHGYIDQLLRLANRTARSRGWAGMLSDVDVENGPMLAAIARNGHYDDARPWHRWIYQRSAPAATPS
jgi:ribosomal protein S18 acetylase RimI-like enzyme